MKTWIALFRGINVGGHNILPMAELKKILESLNLSNVHTYIQSGNVVFDSEAKVTGSLIKRITLRIEERYGFRPHLLLLSRQELKTAIDSNPFPGAVSYPKTLHFGFLATPATNPNLKALGGAKSPTEEFELVDRVFYLHAPDGVGRSKLAANLEKYLGVVVTARNYRTVEKIFSMVVH